MVLPETVYPDGMSRSIEGVPGKHDMVKAIVYHYAIFRILDAARRKRVFSTSRQP